MGSQTSQTLEYHKLFDIFILYYRVQRDHRKLIFEI